MKIRQFQATLHHTESGRKETREVTAWFNDRNEQYEITKVYVQDFKQELLFDKATNTFLIPD